VKNAAICDRKYAERKAQMLKLYIFDMGGVVSLNTDVSERIAERLGLDTGKLWRLMHEEIVSLMAGSITAEEFWKRFSSKSKLQVDEDLWALYFQPRPNREVIETIHALKNEARVVVGTNTIEPHYLVHSRNGDYDIFDGVYASYQIGLVKPDPAFYTHILDREGRAPAETVFVDDAGENVAAARKLGIHSLLFTEAAKLNRDLAALKRGDQDNP
jgi:HAD superfamily hydrolase (TIGR01509 family)